MAGLYIHVPFCIKKCSYCDFASFAGQSDEVKEAYTKAVIDEINSLAPFKADTVFIGGGTPTALKQEQLCGILDAAIKADEVTPTEITIEMNPETVTKSYAKALFDCSVNRVSVGLQTADDRLLKQIGRVHTFERFLEAFSDLREAGFDNINVDIMYGLPGQKKGDLAKTIEKVAALKPEHISAYALTLAENTPLYERVQKGEVLTPAENFEDELLLEQFGYNRYEISNYALKGRECLHNLNYWDNGFYYGVGCGAHGALSFDEAKRIGLNPQKCEIVRTEHSSSIESYIKGDDLKCSFISRDEAMFETVMLGLRKVAGFSKAAFKKRFGIDVDEVLESYIKAHPQLITDDGEHICLTGRGLDIQNTVLVDIMDLFG